MQNSAAQRIVVTAGKLKTPDENEITVILKGQAWLGWADMTLTRSLETCPPVFTLSVYDLDDDTRFPAVPGDPIEVWIGPWKGHPGNQLLTGYIDRLQTQVSPNSRSLTIVGRGKTQDLVDCSARWKGGQIVSSSVLETARKLAEPFGITVAGVPGPAVGSGKVIPYKCIMVGERAFTVIEELCRIAAIIPVELPDGSLYLCPSPGVKDDEQFTFAQTASGFAEGVNVQSAAMLTSADGRYSEVAAHRQSFDGMRDLGNFDAVNTIVTVKDPAVKRYRPFDFVMELGRAMAIENADRRAHWEVARRWGRGFRLSLTTDTWRDSAGALYEVNKLAHVQLPKLGVPDDFWLIAEVTFKAHPKTGRTCDLVLMPPAAFFVQPTLPYANLPADIAGLAINRH